MRGLDLRMEPDRRLASNWETCSAGKPARLANGTILGALETANETTPFADGRAHIRGPSVVDDDVVPNRIRM